MRIDRRKFIKTAGGIALATAAGPLTLRSLAGESAEDQKRKAHVAVFLDRDFPVEQGILFKKSFFEDALSDTNMSFLGVDELQKSISGFDLLITPCGSAFPKQAANALFRYLRDGGNWINLGGIPLGVPVRKTAKGWEKETRQTAYHKAAGIT